MKLRRIIISLAFFAVATLLFRMSGSHKCMEGQPPVGLSYLAGAVTATLPWLFSKWKRMPPIMFGAMLLVSIITASWLANTYHGDHITGNPEFSSGRFWHTPVSGQYPRDRAKTDKYMNRFMIGSKPAVTQSEQDAPSIR